MANSDFGKVHHIFLCNNKLLQVSERLATLAKVDNGQLMADLLTGAVAVYHDRRYDKEQLEAAININLDALRHKYTKQSLKSLEGHFQDLLKISFGIKSSQTFNHCFNP